MFATLGVAIAGILVLGVPLALAARQVVRNDALRRLDREADAVGFAIDDDLEAGRPVAARKLVHFAAGSRFVEVVDAAGHRTDAGRRVVGRSIGSSITLPDGVVVRVSEPVHATDERATTAMVVVAGFGLAGVLAATGLALVVVRRISRPLDELAATSRRLGAGDFSVRVGPTRLPEIDAVGDALNDSARQIERLVESERQFSANASHQLRTPLTALRLRLEELAAHGDPAVRTEAEQALLQAERLESTVDELLTLARTRPGGDRRPVDIGALVEQRARDWAAQFEAAGRSLRVESVPVSVAVSQASLSQALDALLDNALRHGAGTATVEVRPHPNHIDVLVGDEGPGVEAGQATLIFGRHVSLEGGHGVGLALARSLVEAQGGRVDLVTPSPPVFRILLPMS